jgi:nitrate ABC transporter ATP-binding subunit
VGDAVSAYLELSKLGKAFETPKGPAVIVQGFDLALRRGEFVSLIGHSGCGKSTVLAMVAGLSDATEGGVILDNREIWGPGPDRGMVFQAPCLLPWLDAFENVMLGVNKVFPHGTPAERHDIAAYYLVLVGLGDALHKRPAELSGGMRQRVGLARALALRPKVLLLDEPFGMLDSLTRLELQDLLVEIWENDKITALMVTHDVDEAIHLSDRVAMMTSGPRARVGEVMEVPFPRPRDRATLLGSDEYYRLREHLIGFLESQELERSRGAA